MQGFMGIVVILKYVFFFLVRGGGRVQVQSAHGAICSGVKLKKGARRKDIVECLRGSQLLSVLLDISGSYNMKSSI